MISPEAIAEARRQLGRQLAALRKAAGYNTQHEFAPLTFAGLRRVACPGERAATGGSRRRRRETPTHDP
jgi:hypothetical protein